MGEELGADSFHNKPINPTDLLSAVEHALGKNVS
jgi:DNA-binding response OmpR family regulator